jgi:hypothetical protein
MHLPTWLALLFDTLNDRKYSHQILISEDKKGCEDSFSMVVVYTMLNMQLD